MSIADASRSWERRVVEGKFPLQRWLGCSDHSAVFLTQRGAGQESQTAAIKLIEATAIDLDRQLSEWRAAAQLSHPHLIQIFQIGPCLIDGKALLYLVSEYADEDLSQILPQRALAPSEVADMLPPLLDALSYLHKRGLVHRRIRPSNLLAAGDQLKLSSDHISMPTEAPASKTTRDVYDAPETKDGIYSPASDVWSVGITLLAALTQKTAFTRDSRGDPVIPATVPEPFRGIVRECLHMDPKRRCSVSGILARLQPGARSVPAEPVRAPVQARKPFSRGAIGMAVAVIAVLTGLIAFSARGKKETPSPSPTAQQAAPKAAPQVPKPSPSAREAVNKPSPDDRGVAIRQVLPQVSPSARNTITGKIRVVVRVDVDSAGKVTDARLTSPGPSRYFANLALKAARQWEFSPPTSNGEPVASIWAVRFHFGRARTEASPERLRR